MPKILFVRAEWDDQVGGLVATSHDEQGLATEAETIEALSLKLESMVPELADANGYPDGPEVSFELLASCFSIAHRTAH